MACNLMDPDEGYTRALQILYERFGNILHLKDAWLKQVTEGPSLKGNDRIGLRDLADDVRNCYETLRAIKQTECGTPEKAMSVVKRLPYHLQNQYRKEAMKYVSRFYQYPGLEMLADFLDQAARQANDPLFSILNETTESKNQNRRKEVASKASFNTQVKSTGNSVKPAYNISIECSLCKDSHHLYDCSTFKGYKPEGRLAFVRKHRLCFNCLISSEHRVYNCSKSSGCAVKNCKLWHHSLLHEALDYSSNKQGDYKQGDQKNVKQSYASSPGKLDNLEKINNDKVCLPIVKVKVKNVNNHNLFSLALLDPGSDSTFCSKSLLRELGLQGDCIKTRIDTINPGQSTYVELTSLEIMGKKGKQFLLSNVYAVDNIPGMGNSVATRKDTDKWSHLSDLPIPTKVCEEVKLVIGLDNPHLLKPYEVRIGKDREPYAVRYALGWAIHGPVGTVRESKFPMSNFIHSERIANSDDLLCRQVERFWAVDGVEDLGTDDLCMSKDD